MSVALDAAVVVRVAKVRDLPAVAEIESASFSDPWTMDAFVSVLALPHMRFYVAEAASGSAGGHPVAGSGAVGLLGYVVAMFVGDEAEVADLAVSPSARRHGIGGRLLDRVTEDAVGAGVGTMYLEVRESNRPAISVYESRGFRAVGRRPGYYQRPAEDALVLRRDLAPR